MVLISPRTVWQLYIFFQIYVTCVRLVRLPTKLERSNVVNVKQVKIGVMLVRTNVSFAENLMHKLTRYELQ